MLIQGECTSSEDITQYDNESIVEEIASDSSNQSAVPSESIIAGSSISEPFKLPYKLLPCSSFEDNSTIYGTVYNYTQKLKQSLGKLVDNHSFRNDVKRLLNYDCVHDSFKSISKIYDLLERNRLLYEEWVEILCDHGVSDDVLSEVTQIYHHRRPIVGRNNQQLRLEEVNLLANDLKQPAFLFSKVFLTNCNIGDEVCKILAGGLASCTALKYLSLSANGIGDKGAAHIAQVLKIPLFSLDIRSNRIGNPGAIALAKGLQHLFTLNELDLRFNPIGDDGAIALTACISCINFKFWSHKVSKDAIQQVNLGSFVITAADISILAYNIIADHGPKHSRNLQVLNIKCDHISVDAVKALGDLLHNCIYLQTLNLECTYFSADIDGARAIIDRLIQNHGIAFQTLNLKCCSIGAGAMALAKGLVYTFSVSLQTLNLTCDNIGAEVLANGLMKHCTSLQTLNLEQNNIDADGAKAIVDSLKHCSSLHTLSLNRNNIGSGCAKVFSELMHHTNLHTNLRTLNVNNNIGTDLLIVLVKYFISLQILNLEHSNIGADGVKLIVDIRQFTNLQTLSLKFDSIGVNGAKALADGLKYFTSLHTLTLKCCSIGAEGAKAFAYGLEHSSINLQALSLTYDKIGADGTKALADGLKYCTNLRTLNLEYDNIGTDGAKALADGLKHCTNLQTLNLDRNNIGSDGAKVLVVHCNNLETLHLAGNSIGVDGIKALANAFKHCTSLQALYLENNNIGTAGAKALADGLRHCINLQTLNLDWTGISYGAKALADGLEHCNNLQALHLEYNDIEFAGAKALINALQQITSLHTLNFKGNDVRFDDINALADRLKHRISLDFRY